MADTEEQIESLRWAIDRQKADLEGIRKQLRRYLALIITIVVIRLAAYLGGEETIFNSTDIGPLRETGLLWQAGIFQPEAAPVIHDMYISFAAVFSGLGLSILGTAIYGIIAVERLDGCHPTGNAVAIVDENIAQLKGWVEQNDETIGQAEFARKSIVSIGTKAIILLVASFMLQYSAQSSAVVGVLFLFVCYLAYWHLFIGERLLRESRWRKLIDTVVIISALAFPVGAYQDLFGYFPFSIMMVYILLVVAIIGLYLHSNF